MEEIKLIYIAGFFNEFENNFYQIGLYNNYDGLLVSGYNYLTTTQLFNPIIFQPVKSFINLHNYLLLYFFFDESTLINYNWCYKSISLRDISDIQEIPTTLKIKTANIPLKKEVISIFKINDVQEIINPPKIVNIENSRIKHFDIKYNLNDLKETLEINTSYYYNFYLINNITMEQNLNKKIYLNIFSKGALINPYRIPLLNTVVLLTSGCSLMWSHTCLRLRSYLRSILGLCITILFAFYFIFCQAYEYTHAAFSINDGTYGSIFYMLTGLHGFHVIVGTIFLCICLYRLIDAHFTSTNHFGFEAAIWYWHFVDVVWIFLYIFVYVWPNSFYFSGSTYSYNELNNIQINIPVENLFNSNFIFNYNKNLCREFELKIKFMSRTFWKFQTIRIMLDNYINTNKLLIYK